jgi:phenylacetate-CoA ligase
MDLKGDPVSVADSTLAADPAAVASLQAARLRRMIELCFAGHAYYQRVFAARGLTASDIRGLDDLERLPPTSKHDYMAEPEAFRLDVPDLPAEERVLWDVAYTTGTTTGRPTPFYSTSYDFYAMLDQFRRCWTLSGVGPDDVVANLYPLTLFPHGAFLRTVNGATIMGVPLVSTLTGTSHSEFNVRRSIEEAVALVERSRATLLYGVPSFVRRLLMRAKELGADFSRVRQVIFTGEPLPAGMREDIKARLRAVGSPDPWVRDNLGMTEIQGELVECVEHGAKHNPMPDLYFFEIVDERGRRLPDGERGLLALTHLNRRGTVLLRYLIGDVTSLAHDACPHCGRVGQRVVSPPVRTKGLTKIKGMLVNPDLVDEQLLRLPAIDEYQIVVTKDDPADPYSMDQLVVRVATELPDQAALAQTITRRIREAVQVSPRVEFVTKAAIYDPESAMKAVRIRDERPATE